jgi:hypothetical protein
MIPIEMMEGDSHIEFNENEKKSDKYYLSSFI